ncbi:MAG: MFS transporter [Actinomycetota bacterium]|nr:MFS transporter [Actinomycetota bacterium]
MLRAPTWWAPLPRAARWLLFAVVITELGSGLTWPFSLIYLHEARGLPLEQVGTVLAVPALVALVTIGPAGSLVDRVGPLPVVAAGLVLEAGGQLVMASAATFPAALLAALMTGAAQAGVGPAFSTLVVDVVPREQWQRYFAARFAAVNIGAGLGPVIGGLIVDPHRPSTFSAVYVIDAVSFVAPLVVALGPVRHLLSQRTRTTGTPGADAHVAETTPVRAGYQTLLRDRRLRPLLLMVVAASLVGYGQFDSGVPGLARVLGGVSTRTLGWGFGLECGLVAVLQLAVVERLEGHRRTRILMGTAALWATSFALLGSTGLAAGSTVATVLFLLSLVAFALGETLYTAPLMALINDLAPEHLRGRMNSLASLAGQVGYGGGPLLAGALLGRHQPVLLVGLLVAGAGAVVALARSVEPRMSPIDNGITDAHDRIRTDGVGDRAG